MIGTNYFAFYGSLRQGMANYLRYQSSLEFITKETIKGFALYALKDYPYAVKTNNINDELVIEVFKIEDEITRQNIHQLELDAGYIFELIDIAGMKVCIYLFKEPGNNHFVKSGDWVEFFGVSG